jgi:hypothetical protein
MTWLPENKRNLRVEQMTQKEFADWTGHMDENGRKAWERHSQLGTPTGFMLTQEEVTALNKWFQQSFLNSWNSLIAAERKAMREYVKKERRDLVDQINKAIDNIAKAIFKTEDDVLNVRGEITKGLEFRGPLDSQATYTKNNVVMVNGSSFIAVKDNPGQCPGDGWKLLAAAGKRGRDADQVKINQLEKAITDLRTEVKTLRAIIDGEVTNLPDWPRKKA